jgi:hypothetical protein
LNLKFFISLDCFCDVVYAENVFLSCTGVSANRFSLAIPWVRALGWFITELVLRESQGVLYLLTWFDSWEIVRLSASDL